MVQVFAVFGEWKLKNGWNFVVDSFKGGRLFMVEDHTGFDQFVNMICEDFSLYADMESIEIGYMLPKHVLEKMPKNTPPIYINNDRQLHNFLALANSDVVRLCVSNRKECRQSSQRHGVLQNVNDITYSESDDDIYLENDNSPEEVYYVENKAHESVNDIDSGHVDDSVSLDGENGEKLQKNKVIADAEDGGSSQHSSRIKAGDIFNNKDSLISKGKKLQKNKVIADAEDGGSSQHSGGIKTGDIFDNKDLLISKLRYMTIYQNFDFDIVRSTKKLFVAKCFVRGCSWMIRSTVMSNSSPEFLVRRITHHHTCSTTMRYSRHRQATSKCIGRLCLDKFDKSSLLKEVKPQHIIETMKSVYGLKIEYMKAHASLNYARQLVKRSSS